MKIKNTCFTGLFSCIIIMILFSVNLNANASFKQTVVEYSPDGYYKYESEKIYSGLLIDNKQNDNLNLTESSFDYAHQYMGEIQFYDNYNYKYNCTEDDDYWVIGTNIPRDTLEEKINADASSYLKSCYNDDWNEESLKNVYAFYCINDIELRYNNGIRVYMLYANDIDTIDTSHFNYISDVMTDSYGRIYYDMGFSADTDIESAYSIIKSINENPELNASPLYTISQIHPRYIAYKIKDFVFDEDITTDEFQPSISTTTTTTSSSTSTTTIDSVDETTYTMTTTTMETSGSYTYTTTTPAPSYTTTTTITITTTAATSTEENQATTTTTVLEPEASITTTPSPPVDDVLPETYNTPDINLDGIINITDAVIVNRILAGNIDRYSPYIEVADINNDGVIDDIDLLNVTNKILDYSSGNIKSITVNLNSISDGLECYVKVLGDSDISGINGNIMLQKNMFGRYIDIKTKDIETKGSYYIYNEIYYTRSSARYRLISDILCNNKVITVSDSCYK